MTDITLKAGTVVHIEGVPVVLVDDTTVSGSNTSIANVERRVPADCLKQFAGRTDEKTSGALSSASERARDSHTASGNSLSQASGATTDANAVDPVAGTGQKAATRDEGI